MLDRVTDHGTDQIRRLDTQSMNALTHPLRVEILALLRSDGQATTTQLADRLCQRPGTVAWHVKQLLKHRFVEDLPQRGTNNERWFRATQNRIEVHPADFGDAPGAGDALRTYAGGLFATAARRVSRWLNGEWGAEWSDAVTVSDWAAELTPEQLGALVRDVGDVLARYTDAAADRPEPGARRVIVQLQAFPDATEQTPAEPSRTP